MAHRRPRHLDGAFFRSIHLCAVPDGRPPGISRCWVIRARIRRFRSGSSRFEVTMNAPLRLLRIPAVAATLALATTFAYPMPASPTEHVGINAERGDPARWYVPADTPQLKYETQVKEAHAALGEELKECRALQAGRSDCVALAKSQHRRDLADARAQLLESRGGAPAIR
jgi:hypothetical protein